MKPIITLLAIILTLGLGACSTCQKPPRECILSACCATSDPDKHVMLHDSFDPEGRVVRLAH